MAAGRAADGFFHEEQAFLDGQFDIFDWHPYFQSCVRYFLEHAQYNGPVQALAAFINIQLPFQRAQNLHPHPLVPRTSPSPGPVPGPPPPVGSQLPFGIASNNININSAAAGAAGSSSNAVGGGRGVSPSSQFPHPAHPHATTYHHHAGHPPQPPQQHTSLQPYIRRLVVTGFDFPAVLHGFFGDDWQLGVAPLHEQERRNYLFAAKSSSWLEVKRAYDMGVHETVPFLRPLRNVAEGGIVAAEGGWSEWLAMQDWMLGPRSVETRGEEGPAPSSSSGGRGVRIKREDD